MVKRFAYILAAVLVAGGVTACKKKPVNTLAQRQAQFKAEQKVKALRSYQDLVKKYPDSEYAAKAKERIHALQPPATPAKK